MAAESSPPPAADAATNNEAQEVRQLLALFSANRFAEAGELAARLVQRSSQSAFGWKAYGVARLALGANEDALQALQRALQLTPSDPEVHGNLADACLRLGRIEAAEAGYRQSLALKPDLHHARRMLGEVLLRLGRRPEAEACFREYLQAIPDSFEVLSALSGLLIEQNGLAEAVELYEHALRLKPEFCVAHANLGNAYAALGRLDDADTCLKRSQDLQPDWLEGRSNYLFFLAHTKHVPTPDYLAHARQWEIRGIAPAVREQARRKAFPRSAPGTGGRLRVGYVSGDFRTHPISMFMEPLLHRHDRKRVDVYAYHAYNDEDRVTRSLRKHAENWRPIAGLSDESAAGLIERDGIDILVDLSGHARHNRLGIFARRAAPVQCHYLGYYASTGLTEMDYWIADAVLVPPGMERLYTETVWRLPRVWLAYAAPEGVPDPRHRPQAPGRVCLGSFNHLGKVTPATIELWARTLRALPNSTLLLKTKELDEPENCRRVLATFQGKGISADRIQLRGRTASWAEHMSTYDEIDVALDPVAGAVGGTTTCEALWMGVPVVSLYGESHGERMSSTMVSAIGHPDWGVASEEAYVRKVGELAADAGLRRRLRESLRRQVQASPLADVDGLARVLEDAYASMFERFVTIRP